jgi:nitroreductase
MLLTIKNNRQMKNETIKTAEATATLKTIYERRAVRKYKDMPVNAELINNILDAGRMAPSAMNKQSWKFYILTHKETIRDFSKEISKIAFKEFLHSGPKKILKTISDLLRFSHRTDLFKSADPVFYGAPVVIFITAAKKNEWAALDIGMCSQNIMLAAKSLGLDSCPVGFGKYVEHTEIFSRLKIPSAEQVHLAVILGYGNENPEVHKRITDNAFYID